MHYNEIDDMVAGHIIALIPSSPGRRPELRRVYHPLLFNNNCDVRNIQPRETDVGRCTLGLVSRHYRLAIMTLEDNPKQQIGGALMDNKDDHARKELDAMFLVLDSIIDLGLGDRGLSQRK